MDRFARNYLIGLVAIMLIVAGGFWLSQDGRLAQINDRLAADTQLGDYPFRFRVLALDNGVATLTSPRSAQVPAMRFLRTAYPELARTAVDHPDMMAAQDVLAATQSRAAELVEREADVTSIRWVIDERWYNERGVMLNLNN